MIPFMFQKGNKAAGCEDAPPIAGQNYCIVADGLGASGLTKHKVVENGIPLVRTSAYLGSRILSESVREFYNANYSVLMDMAEQSDSAAIEGVLLDLKEYIAASLKSGAEQLQIKELRSRALKIFPSTLASVLYREKEDSITLCCVWAGDSRIYVLSPETGLSQVSLDDADDARAMNSESSMNNCISAYGSFRLNYGVISVPSPCIVFCASDGCFDYRPSPLHFEWLLINTILNHLPPAEGEALGSALSASVLDNMYQSIGDDTTMAGMLFGFQNTEELSLAFARRMESFGADAINMNSAIRALRSVQSERTAANKTVRLLSERMNELLRQELTRAMQSDDTPLRQAISATASGAEYFSRAAEQKREYSELSESARMLYQKASERSAAEGLELLRLDLLKSRLERSVFARKSDKLPNAALAAEIAGALARLLEDNALPQQSGFSDCFPDAEAFSREKSGLISALCKLSALLSGADKELSELWERSCLHSPRFAAEMSELASDESVNALLSRALVEPESFGFVTDSTLRSLRKSQNELAERLRLLELADSEHARELENMTNQFFSEQGDKLISELLMLPEDEFSALFELGSVASVELNKYAAAQRTLIGSVDLRDSAQEQVTQIWESYRSGYALYDKIECKGAI